MNQSNYLNKITSEVAKLAITITHSNISRGQSPLGILGKLYLKSEWRPSSDFATPALSDSRLGIDCKSKEYNLFYICATFCSFGRICTKISLTAPTIIKRRAVNHFEGRSAQKFFYGGSICGNPRLTVRAGSGVSDLRRKAVARRSAE